ncbi:MAG TPA: hypothetical protein VI072_10480 [Polyangiaceae bacterium]
MNTTAFKASILVIALGATHCGPTPPAGGGAGGTGGGNCNGTTFPPAGDVAARGPFAVTSEAASGADCTIYRPAVLGECGRKHPVIIWGNGTGGPTPVYGAAFEHWASHGFIVAAANPISGQGSGAPLLACLDYVHRQDTTAGSAYQGKVDRTRAGASGHSQGGGGALMAGRDARVTATAPLQPYIQAGFGGFDPASITRQTGAMLLLSGTNDTIAAPATNQQPVFNTTNVPVFWGNLVGGDHIAVALNGLATYREVMLSWFRVQLMGDDALRGEFYGASCGLCDDAAWRVQRKGL